MANRGTVARGGRRATATSAPTTTGPAAAVRLSLLVAFEVAAIGVLHRLGADPGSRVPWHDLGRWAAESQPEDAAWAAVRLIGLACAYWQLASTLAYLAARLSGLPRLVAGVRWACLPGVRRLVDTALALSIVASAALSAAPAGATTPTTAPAVVVQVGGSQAAAASQPHTYRPVAAGDAALGQPVTSSSTSTSTSVPPIIAGAPTAATAPGPGSTQPPPPGATLAPPVSPGRARPPEAASKIHDVVAGDNLWDIAAAHLAQATGRPAQALTDGEIASYWVRLMAANRGLLLSGNPNLIFPGERVICPPPEVGQR